MGNKTFFAYRNTRVLLATAILLIAVLTSRFCLAHTPGGGPPPPQHREPGDPPGNDPVPIDESTSLLLLSGMVYGLLSIKRQTKTDKQKPNTLLWKMNHY